MEHLTYESLRHFADSWGLLYMVAVFVLVVAFVLRPAAGAAARRAAAIPLDDERASTGDKP
jgi:cytochrome c oxidase cbb3-type subunit 4